MAATINQSFISQFSDNIHLLLEQKGSKLRKVFPVEMAKGEKHFFERLGNFVASEVVGRLADTALQDPAHSRRMATVKRYHASTYLDDIDKFKLLIDPTSDYSLKLANAHGKNYDTVVIDAILGTANTGADGSGTQAFDTSNQQIAHGGTGLTVAKFNQALRILEGNEVDIETNGQWYQSQDRSQSGKHYRDDPCFTCLYNCFSCFHTSRPQLVCKFYHQDTILDYNTGKSENTHTCHYNRYRHTGESKT